MSGGRRRRLPEKGFETARRREAAGRRRQRRRLSATAAMGLSGEWGAGRGDQRAVEGLRAWERVACMARNHGGWRRGVVAAAAVAKRYQWWQAKAAPARESGGRKEKMRVRRSDGS